MQLQFTHHLENINNSKSLKKIILFSILKSEKSFFIFFHYKSLGLQWFKSQNLNAKNITFIIFSSFQDCSPFHADLLGLNVKLQHDSMANKFICFIQVTKCTSQNDKH